MATKKFVTESSEEKPQPTFIQKILGLMGYEQKFYLVFAMVLGCLLMVSAFLAEAYLEDLRFLSSEIAGLQVQQKVENVLEDVIRHKILSYRYNLGDAELKKELIELQGVISKDISSLVESLKTAHLSEQDFKTREEPSIYPGELQKQWEEYTSLVFDMKGEEGDAFHVAFVDSLQELLNFIGESSNLSYDYEPETHHLIQMNLWLIPDLQDIASQLLILSHSLSKKDSLSPVDINKLITLTTVLREDLNSLKQQYKKALIAGSSNEIKENTLIPYNALQESGAIFLRILEDLRRSEKKDGGLFSDINLSGLKFLSKADQLFGATLKQEERLVEERYTALKNKSLMIATLGGGLLALVSLFTFFVIRELNSYLTKLHAGVARFRHGDLKARIPDAYDKSLQRVTVLLNELGNNYEHLVNELQVSGEQLASVSEEATVNNS